MEILKASILFFLLCNIVWAVNGNLSIVMMMMSFIIFAFSEVMLQILPSFSIKSLELRYIQSK